MIGGRDLPCAYHAGSIITNFCQDAECLMPLCPKCLPIHTVEHKSKGSYSELLSIDDALEQTQQLIHRRVDYLREIQSCQDKSSVKASELRVGLKQAVAEARIRIQSEIDSFFAGLEQKCSKMCAELSSRQKGDSKALECEGKINELLILEDGMKTKEKCLMSLIKAMKKLDSSENIEELDNDEVQQVGTVQLRVDLQKLTEISDLLIAYAKPMYVNNISSVNGSQISGVSNNQLKRQTSQEELNSHLIRNNKRDQYEFGYFEQEVEEQQQEEDNEQQNIRDDKADDIYLLNDPEIIKIRQRREERRIKQELREIGKKQINPAVVSPRKQEEMQHFGNTNNQAAKKTTSQTKNQNEERSSNFVTFEKPAREKLQSFAKPEEIDFLENMHIRSQMRQREFDMQQNQIYKNALQYQIPSPKNYRPQSPSQQPTSGLNSNQQISFTQLPAEDNPQQQIRSNKFIQQEYQHSQERKHDHAMINNRPVQVEQYFNQEAQKGWYEQQPQQRQQQQQQVQQQTGNLQQQIGQSQAQPMLLMPQMQQQYAQQQQQYRIQNSQQFNPVGSPQASYSYLSSDQLAGLPNSQQMPQQLQPQQQYVSSQQFQANQQLSSPSHSIAEYQQQQQSQQMRIPSGPFGESDFYKAPFRSMSPKSFENNAQNNVDKKLGSYESLAFESAQPFQSLPKQQQKQQQLY